MLDENVIKPKYEFDKWYKNLEQMPFEEQANAIKDKIIEHGNFDYQSRHFFEDAFEYFMNHLNNNRGIKWENFYDYMTKIKGYPPFNYIEFNRILALLALCGFEVSKIVPQKS